MDRALPAGSPNRTVWGSSHMQRPPRPRHHVDMHWHWHRGDNLLQLLRRAQRELGAEALSGTRFLFDAREMLAATREIEAAARASGGTLLVGFQRAEKLDGEAATYRALLDDGVRVVAFGTGRPRPLPGLRWVELPEDQTALQNQWFLVAVDGPGPIAFVGFETSPPERFGRVGVTDPSRTWAGFVTDDRRLVGAIAEHLRGLGDGAAG